VPLPLQDVKAQIPPYGATVHVFVTTTTAGGGGGAAAKVEIFIYVV
jgi:hypothetical protein